MGFDDTQKKEGNKFLAYLSAPQPYPNVANHTCCVPLCMPIDPHVQSIDFFRNNSDRWVRVIFARLARDMATQKISYDLELQACFAGASEHFGMVG